jgi:hypothetical protein
MTVRSYKETVKRLKEMNTTDRCCNCKEGCALEIERAYDDNRDAWVIISNCCGAIVYQEKY